MYILYLLHFMSSALVFCFPPPAVDLSASPYSRLSPIPPACRHVSPESIAAARNDITHYTLSHLPSSLHPPPLTHSVHRRAAFTHAAITARFELLPEGLHVCQVQFVEGDGHLSDGIVPAKAVVVEDLQVQRPLDNLLIWKTWERICRFLALRK